LTAEEIDLSQDLNDWNKLNEEEIFHQTYSSFFLLPQTESLNENLAENFVNEVQLKQFFYGFRS
jgi:ribonucleotide reductase beta subunit family protein with ferritin-like domain